MAKAAASGANPQHPCCEAIELGSMPFTPLIDPASTQDPVMPPFRRRSSAGKPRFASNMHMLGLSFLVSCALLAAIYLMLFVYSVTPGARTAAAATSSNQLPAVLELHLQLPATGSGWLTLEQMQVPRERPYVDPATYLRQPSHGDMSQQLDKVRRLGASECGPLRGICSHDCIHACSHTSCSHISA